MVEVGYTMMCEQAGPRQLVADVVAAESAGFDFAVISDHYFPWLDEQGPVGCLRPGQGAVPLVRRRLEGQQRVARPVVVRRRQPVRG